MKFRIAEYPNEPYPMCTMVILETTCPLCHKYVRFAMHEDKPEIIDARIEYLENKVQYWKNLFYTVIKEGGNHE